MVAMFAVAVGYGVVLPVLPFHIERLLGSKSVEALSRHTGLLTGTYVLAIFVFAPMWGRLSDRHGRRRVLLLGLMGFAFSLALFGVADSLAQLYVMRFLSGLFASAVAPSAYALIGDYASTKEWRAHRFALLNVAQAAGFFIGPVAGGVAMLAAKVLFGERSDGGFLAAILVTSVLALAAGLIVRCLVPLDPAARGESQPAAPEPDNGKWTSVRLLAISFLTALAIGAFEVGLALRSKETLGLNAYQIGLMFAECSLVMLAVQAIVFSPLIRPQSTRWFLAPGLATLAASLAAVPFAPNGLAMAIGVALVAASAGLLSPIAIYWISLGAGQKQGASLGGETAIAGLGQAVGSGLGGLLFGIAYLPNAAFMLTAALVATGFVATIGLQKGLERLLTSGADLRH